MLLREEVEEEEDEEEDEEEEEEEGGLGKLSGKLPAFTHKYSLSNALNSSSFPPPLSGCNFKAHRLKCFLISPGATPMK